jgi:anti-sigma B factor antagonist
VHGSLTASERDPGLQRVIRLALDHGSRTIVINLQNVLAIDSAGVSELAFSHTTLAGRGGRLMICNLSQKLKDILIITRLNKVFDAYETEDEAIASAEAT